MRWWTQLRSVTPALSETDITRERLALEEAIRKVEAEAVRQMRSEQHAGTRPTRAPPLPRRGGAIAIPSRSLTSRRLEPEPATEPMPEPPAPRAPPPLRALTAPLARAKTDAGSRNRAPASKASATSSRTRKISAMPRPKQDARRAKHIRRYRRRRLNSTGLNRVWNSPTAARRPPRRGRARPNGATPLRARVYDRGIEAPTIEPSMIRLRPSTTGRMRSSNRAMPDSLRQVAERGARAATTIDGEQTMAARLMGGAVKSASLRPSCSLMLPARPTGSATISSRL